MDSPVRPFNASELQKVEAQLRRSTTEFVRKRRGVADRRRPKRSTASRRAECGRVGRPKRTVWWTNWADWTARLRSPRNARIFQPSSDVEVDRLSRSPKSFYELVSESFSGNSEAAVSAMAVGESVG